MEKLKFNVTEYYRKAKKLVNKADIKGITIKFPGISINLAPTDSDKKISKEIILKLRHKRVISQSECCDNCIKNSLTSLFEIKDYLIDKQVEMSDVESPLFILTDMALLGINRFLTFTEGFDDFKDKEKYFEALNLLRGHLIKTFDEVAKIASLPNDFGFRLKMIEGWDEETYIIENK